MTEYLVGLFNGICIFFILGSFITHNYLVGILLCLLNVSLIFFVFQVVSIIKLRKEAKEIEDIINGAKNEINKEFGGTKM